MVAEGVVNHLPNARAWDWMKDNIPLFTCPDPEVERTYYYRWWAFRKHIKHTPAGFILTEFIRPVDHATDHNAISCALAHHIGEGRWLKDPRYIDEYLNFWLKSGEDGGLQRHFHQYSGWAAAAAYDRWLADGRTDFLVSLLDALTGDYRTWERAKDWAVLVRRIEPAAANYLVKLGDPVGSQFSRRGDKGAASVISPERHLGARLEGAVDEVSAGRLRFSFRTLTHREKSIAIRATLAGFVNSKGLAGIDEDGRPVRAVDGALVTGAPAFHFDEGSEFRLSVGR